jgi:hypothetical protein
MPGPAASVGANSGSAAGSWAIFTANETADLPLPRALRDALVAAGKARGHRWRTDSGWVTIAIDSNEGIELTIRLMWRAYDRARTGSGAGQPTPSRPGQG